MILDVFFPQIGGMDVDLPALSSAMTELGGLQEVIDKKKWVKLADMLHIPTYVSTWRLSRDYSIGRVLCL